MLRSVGAYVQGPRVIRHAGRFAAPLGKKAFLLGGTTALSLTKEDILSSLAEHKVAQATVQPGVQICSVNAVNSLVEVGKASGADVVVSVGGGSAVDAGKLVAYKMGVPVICIGTVCSTACGPTTALSVVYNEDHTFKEYAFYPRNPDVVMMDSKLIAESSPEYLVAGMGDTYAAYFEAIAASKGSPNLVGGRSLPLAYRAAKDCWDQCREYGLEAKLANEKKVVTPALERLIETCTYTACLGYESGGMSGAHSIHNGLVNVGVVSLHRSVQPYAPHGQVIAFTTLALMILDEKTPEQIEEVIAFNNRVGLATTMEDIAGGKDVPDDVLTEAAKFACAKGETIHYMQQPIRPDMVFAAVKEADALGHAYKEKNE
ncbi:MAG: glycerol dehydrogenase [Candidatus Bathyarchaeia archaeon]